MSQGFLFRDDCYACNNRKNKLFEHITPVTKWNSDPNFMVDQVLLIECPESLSIEYDSDASDDSCASNGKASKYKTVRCEKRKNTKYYSILNFLNFDINLKPLLPDIGDEFKMLFEMSNISSVTEGKQIPVQMTRFYGYGDFFYIYHFSTSYSANQDYDGSLLYNCIAHNFVEFLTKCISVERKSNDPGVLVYLYKKYSRKESAREASNFFSSIVTDKESARSAFMLYISEYIPR